MKKGLILSLFSLAACLLVFTLLEISLRVAEFEYPPADDPIAIWNKTEDRELRLGRGLHRTAARQLWEPRPGAEIPRTWSGDLERVNSAGYRGPLRTMAKTAGVLRVATLGDSSTFGFGVPYAETYSAQLEARLNDAGTRAEVLDFGVIGFTLLQGIERYRARVREYHPDVVVAAFGSVNDHHIAQGLPDAAKIAQAESNGTLYARCRRLARENSRVCQMLASVFDSLHGESTQAREERERREVEFDAAREHMGAIDFESTWHGVRRVSVAEFETALAEFKRSVEADGAVFVVVSMPRRPGVDVVEVPVLRKYSLIIADFCKSSGAPLYDGRGDFRDYREVEHGDPSLFFLDGDDYHPSQRGHARLARGLCATIVKSMGPH